MKDRIKVLVVDDAIVVRILVGNTISKEPDFEFIGKAENGKVALEKIAELKPDIVILDIEMPEMSGLEVLKVLKKQGMPTKVIMFSTYTTVGAEATFEALDLGAADFVPKPSSSGFSDDFEKVKEDLLSKIRFLGSARVSQPVMSPRPVTSTPSLALHPRPTHYDVIVFEGGMGAPKTFMNLIPQLPQDMSAGVLIFQSMFSGFAEQFVRRVSQNANLHVKAAEDGDAVQPGHGLVLFGDYYVSTIRLGSELHLAFRAKDASETYGSVPRILCESVAKTCREKAIGVLLAGSGEGNVEGIQAMKAQGSLIIAEEPTTTIAKQVLDQFLEKHLIDHVVATQDIVPTLAKTLRLSA